MPSKRTYRLKERKVGGRKLSGADRTYLLTGVCLGVSSFHAEIEAEPVWQQQRVPLLLEWIKKRPFTRPYGWWQFGGKPRGELRSQVSGPPPLADSPVCMGIPNWWQCKELTWETEFSFLRRLNLLTRPELQLLKDKTPEEIAALEVPTRRLLPDPED
jgi:hypothetical protein